MPLNLTDKQIDNLEKLGIREGDTEWKGLKINLTPDGNFSMDGSQKVDVSQQELDRFATAYQTTTKRRKKTDERVNDLDARTNYDTGDEGMGTDNGGTGTDGGNDQEKNDYDLGVQGEIDALNAWKDEQIAYLEGNLDRLSRQADGAYRHLVSSMKSVYGARIDMMKKENEKLLATKETVGIRTGRQRYAPVVQQGILTAEEIAGHERISKLEADLVYALAQAEQAKADDDYKRFNDSYDKIDDLESQTRKQIADLYKIAVDENNARIKKAEADRKAEQENLEAMYKRSEESAGVVALGLADFDNTEDQFKYISGLADAWDIDFEILATDAYAELSEQQKAKVDLDRVIQLTNTGWASNNREEEEYQTDKDEKEMRDELRKEIRRQLDTGAIDDTEARKKWNLWFPMEDFDKEFINKDE